MDTSNSKMRTYYILYDDDGPLAIKCLKCSMTSYHKGDVRNLYCKNCNYYHNGLEAPLKEQHELQT